MINDQTFRTLGKFPAAIGQCSKCGAAMTPEHLERCRPTAATPHPISMPRLCCENEAANILVGADRAVEALKSGADKAGFGVLIDGENYIFNVTKQGQ